MRQKPKFIAAGYDHVGVVLEDDTMKCWGQSSGYGYGDRLDRGDQPNELGDFLPSVPLP